jgi:hypothetical protein
MASKILLLIIAALLAVGFSTASANDAGVTPYGDYCVECAVYGVCKYVVPQEEAVRAMDRYYRDRGYRMGEFRHRGRFVEAIIYKDDHAVDRVIFDRKTGRLRSIY